MLNGVPMGIIMKHWLLGDVVIITTLLSVYILGNFVCSLYSIFYEIIKLVSAIGRYGILSFNGKGFTFSQKEQKWE